MKKLIILLLFIPFVFACNENKNKYEFLIKDESFKNNFIISTNEDIIQLSEGFTYYKWENKSSNISPIVLVHGFSVPSYIWEPTFKMLAEKGYYVIMLDLYGRGYSENLDKAYTDELLANQVLDLLNELNVISAKFIGLSNGGRVISKVADLKPKIVEKLIYVASSGFREVIEETNKSVSEKEVEDFISKNYPTISKGQLLDFKYPEKHIGWDVKYEELLKYKGFANALISTRKNHYTMDEIHTKIQLSAIPTYTIWGESDKVVVFENFKKRIDSILPRRKDFFITESGHLPHMENQIDFDKILLSIIKDNIWYEKTNLIITYSNTLFWAERFKKLISFIIVKKYLKEWWYVYAIGAFSGLISVIKPDYWWVYIIVFAIVVGIMSGEIYFTKDKKKDDK